MFNSIDALRDKLVTDMTDLTPYEREVVSMGIDAFADALTHQPEGRAALLAIITKRFISVHDLPDSVGRLSPQLLKGNEPNVDEPRS